MKKLAIGIILLASTMLIGCDRRISDKDMTAYGLMVSAQQEKNVSIDVKEYRDAIMFILDPMALDINYIENNKDKYRDLIADELIQQIELKARNMSKSNLDYEDDENLKNPYENIELFEKDGQYPIYSTHYTINGYGTLEEAKEAIERFKEIPTNIVQSYDVCKDEILIHVDNKYSGTQIYLITITDDKISKLTNYGTMGD